MAKVDFEYQLALVLQKNELERMLKGLKEMPEGSWIRYCIEDDGITDEVTVYAQGPDGEEKCLYTI